MVRILDTAMLGAGGQLLEPGTVEHASQVVVAAFAAVVIVAGAIVAVAVIAVLFMISRPRAGRISGRAGDAGIPAKECAIWPRTGGCRA